MLGFSDYLNMIYRHKWWLLLSSVLAESGAYVLYLRRPEWSIDPLCYCLTAFLAGGAWALFFVLLFASPEVRVRNPNDLRAAGLPVVGLLPALSGWTARPRFMPASTVENLRRVVLDGMSRGASVLIASPSPQEGRTSIALSLAVSIAETGRRVLLIDGDPTPTARKLLASRSSGCGELLWREGLVKAATHPSLDVLPASKGCWHASELFDEARRDYDVVVVDSAPFLRTARVVELASAADSVFVVARAGSTSKKALSSTLTYLRRLNANVLGLVLNRA